MNIGEGILILAVATGIGWPVVSYVGKNFERLSNMDENGLTAMVLENQCAQVDARYIDVSELAKKNGGKKEKKSATNLCGLDN